MNPSKEQAVELVENVRIAHRLSVGFYQRMMPKLDAAAEALDSEFWYWEPVFTARPAASGTRPTRKWLWDMVPLFASRHVYRKVAGGPLQKGDMAVSFCLYLDDGFKPEKRKAAGVKGDPDPVLLPAGAAVLELELYRASADATDSFDAVWDKADAPDTKQTAWHQVHESLQGYWLSMPLPDVMHNPDDLVSVIRQQLALP